MYPSPLLNAYKSPFGLGIGFPSALKQLRHIPVNELINSFLTSGSFLNTSIHIEKCPVPDAVRPICRRIDSDGDEFQSANEVLATLHDSCLDIHRVSALVGLFEPPG